MWLLTRFRLHRSQKHNQEEGFSLCNASDIKTFERTGISKYAFFKKEKSNNSY